MIIANVDQRGAILMAPQDQELAREATTGPCLPCQSSQLCCPEQLCSERWIDFFLFVFSFLYLCLFRRFTAMEPDEGIILQGAQRVLTGQVLYRDFFSFYTPGSYYVLALLFRIFGSSILVARTALALTGAILSLLIYLLARRVCSRAVALTMALLTTFTALPYRFLVLHNWDSTLWACLTLYCAVRLLEVPGWKWAIALGSCTSLTILFEQSKGAGLIVGLTAGYLAIFFLRGRKPLVSGGQVLVMIFGFAWPFAITFAYLTTQHAISSMLTDWVWPLQHYSRANHVPYGYQNWSDDSRKLLFGTGSVLQRLLKVGSISPLLWIPALPLVAAVLFVCWIIQARRRMADNRTLAYYLIITASFLGLSLSTAVVRADIIHFMYLQPLNCLVLAWLMQGTDIPGRFIKSAKPFLAVYIVTALLLFGLAPLLADLSASNEVTTRRGVLKAIEKDSVVNYVQQHVPAGETILIYPYLPLYYDVTDTFSPTRYDYFQPGMHTKEEADEIIGELGSRRVKTVLFEISFPEKIPHAWPGSPLSAIIDDPVADYLVRNYRTCSTLKSPMNWYFIFMIRRDLACL